MYFLVSHSLLLITNIYMISPWAYTRVGCQPRGGLPALSVSECGGLIFGWAYTDGRSLLISYCYPDITSSGQELGFLRKIGSQVRRCGGLIWQSLVMRWRQFCLSSLIWDGRIYSVRLNTGCTSTVKQQSWSQ